MEHYFDRLIRGLGSLGHSVDLVTTRLDENPPNKSDIRFHFLQAATDSKGWDWRQKLRKFYARLLPTPDVILSNSFAAYPLVGAPIPVVTIVHGTGLVNLVSSLRLAAARQGSSVAPVLDILRLLRRPSFLCQKKLLRRSARIITVSSETKNATRKTYNVPPEKIEVVPPPVDTGVFHPAAEVCFAAPSNANPFKIISVGTLSRQKGFEFVLEALARLHRRHPTCFQLKLVGHGPEEKRLRIQARSSSIDPFVTFTGELGECEVAEAYRGSDLFVLPTLREEGFPVVIAEALASGIPVVATRVGGNPSAVRDALDGYLVNAGSTVDLAETIERLAWDPALRRQMSRSARARALADLDIVCVSRKTERLLEAVARDDY